MELGTIIITGNNQPKNSRRIPRSKGKRNSATLSPSSYPIAFWDLLGHSVLQRTIERLRRSGAQLISVFNNEDSVATISHGEPWETAVFDLARNGVQRILLITLGAYTEFDVDDLMRFHIENKCRVTNLSDGQEPFGITVMEAKFVANHSTPLRNRLTALVSCSCNYENTGFANPLASPADYRQLVQDSLAGHCQIKPIGKEIQPGIWIAEGARIPRSVRVLGPYVAPAPIAWMLEAMAMQNFSAALRMSMPEIIHQYIRSFDLQHRITVLRAASLARYGILRVPRRQTSRNRAGCRPTARAQTGNLVSRFKSCIFGKFRVYAVF